MGVDIGTSGCKAVVFDGDGRPIADSYREYQPIFLNGGGAELDSAEVLERCMEVIAEAAGAAGGGEVAGLGISSQGEAFTPIAADGRPTGNGMISSDTRAASYASEWAVQFGQERLYQITGHTAHPMFSLFKLLWVRDNEPDVWSKAARFLCYEDLLQWRLGLDPCLGWPLAARTMMFDVRRHEWSREILGAVGLEERQLGLPLPSGTRSGAIRGSLAGDLNLMDGAIVVTGGHDQPCAALGAGAVRPGLAMYATGTVECITPAFERAVFSDELRRNNLATYDHTAPGMYVTVAFNLTGGNLLKWFRDEFGAREVEEAARSGRNAYEVLLEQAAPEPTDLLVLPYFTPSGTPYFDTRTPGAILGLRLTTGRGEILRALLEGVAYEMRLNLEILRDSGCGVEELRAVGGGAKSAFWTQLKADVLGKPITVLGVTEAGCLGAAMLAAFSLTGEPVTDLADRWVRPVTEVHPRREAADAYTERFECYRDLYPGVSAVRLP